jgi:hypothetical protein
MFLENSFCHLFFLYSHPTGDFDNALSHLLSFIFSSRHSFPACSLIVLALPPPGGTVSVCYCDFPPWGWGNCSSTMLVNFCCLAWCCIPENCNVHSINYYRYTYSSSWALSYINTLGTSGFFLS